MRKDDFLLSQDQDKALWRAAKSIRLTESCWLWTASKAPFGYGKFPVGRLGWMGAHRAIYQLVNGRVAEGKVVCHTCDVPACVNPQHMFVGTQKDNLVDAARKHRMNRQGKNYPTHCRNGHSLSDNPLVGAPGPNSGIPRRRCRTCCNESRRERRRKSADRPIRKYIRSPK